jgi:hypothetical protein
LLSQIQIKSEMKKLFSIALVAGIFSFYACDQQPAEESTEVEVTTQEETPTVYEEPAMEMEMETDTLAPAETPAE